MSKMSPFEAAVQYHVNCELYDRSVCTGPMGRDGILPANRREQQMIEANAQQERFEAAKQAKLPLSDMDSFIRDNRAIDESIYRVRIHLEHQDTVTTAASPDLSQESGGQNANKEEIR